MENKEWPRHFNPLILGAAAGFLGSVARAILELSAIALLPSYKSCVRLAAALFLSPEYVMSRFDAYIVGLEVDLIVGMVVGIVAVLILAKWGCDHLLVKGGIGGALTWVIFYAFLSADPVSRLNPTGTFLEAEVSLLIHVIFGVAVVWSAYALESRTARRAETGGRD